MDRVKLVENLNRIRSTVVPADGSFAIAPLETTGMPNVLSNFIRVFRAIDFGRGRRPSKPYDPDFDMFTHVLSDSPTTIAWKMEGDWRDYAHHAIVQIGSCNFRCFYCYVDYRFLAGRNVIHVTAEDILSAFLRHRDALAQEGVRLNVLRISGGEPLLAPDLTLSCLKMLRQAGLDNEVCIKTETNLSPLVPTDRGCAAAQWADLREFREFRNFIMHPTFHGIDGDSLQRNASAPWDEFEMMLDAVRTLIDLEIDFYPSFGANTVTPGTVDPFFRALKDIHPKLPLRVAVRKFDLGYESPATRDNTRRNIQVFDGRETIRRWHDLLQAEYGVGYGEVPRHEIPLSPLAERPPALL